MNLTNFWNDIKAQFEAAWQSSLHFSVATVDSNGNPHVTPIGSLILRDDCTGYYFEEFPVRLPENLKNSPRVAILALNSDLTFWMESLTDGTFKTYPGMRLMGKSIGSREATSEEIAAWQQKVSFAEGLKGHAILWKDMKMIREIQFDEFKPVYCGEMTAHLHE